MSTVFDTPTELARWRSRLLLALGVAGLLFGLFCLTLDLQSNHEHDRGVVAAVDLLVGWSFIATGLFAWWRRPLNRTGVLMTALGFAWFAQTLSAANDEVLFTIGIALDSLFPSIAGHLLLAPTHAHVRSVAVEMRLEKYRTAHAPFGEQPL